ncbi:MAG: hypothetical protein ACXWYS_09535 [Gaiellaceae bacterium]
MPALTRPFRFRHSLIIEVGGCPIGLAPSLKYLDASKLEEAERAEIEVGVVEGTCCSRTVRATVEKGLVTSIKVDGCADRKDDKPLHPEVQKLLKAALKEATKRRRGKTATLPVPVKTFLARPERIVTINCFCVCVLDDAICYICCVADDGSSSGCSRW